MAWEANKQLNRRYQAAMNQEDGFLTGYWLLWIQVPDAVSDVFSSLFGPDTYNLVTDASDMSKALSALATGVPSIPDTTYNQTSMNGVGGTKWGVTTNIDTPSTFSVKFRELQGMPILKTIVSWFTLIRDPQSGASLLTGSDYTKKNFFGNATLVYLKPDMQTVESATVFEGICPLKYPTDLLNSDNATVEPLEPEVEFHVDSIWNGQSAYQAGVSIVSEFNQMEPFHQPASPSIYVG